MALNPFFLQGSKGEQGLMQDLINESIQMYGVEVHYMPRLYLGQNRVIKENVVSAFRNALPIEMYLQNYDGWEGQEVELSKFGIEAKDEVVLVVSQERYETYIEPLINRVPNTKMTSRPKEGDLIYFPLGDVLFEIKNVKRDKPFYQLQKNYVYELSCELFRFEDEIIETGIEEIDDEIIDLGYQATFTLTGAGTSASAIAGMLVSNSGVKDVTLLDRGYSYTTTPLVTISPPSSGETATAVAITTAIGDGTFYVDRIEITNPGYGYTEEPDIQFIGGIGDNTRIALAKVNIAEGTVGIVTVTDSGSGYVLPPQVTFSPPVGVGDTALGVAVLTNGEVSSINMLDSGSGYTEEPTVTIALPESFGTDDEASFKLNEIITGETSGATARVRSYNTKNFVLSVSNITDAFILGERITSSGGSSLTLGSVNYIDTTQPYTQSVIYEAEADEILDFTETNPFGGV